MNTRFILWILVTNLWQTENATQRIKKKWKVQSLSMALVPLVNSIKSKGGSSAWVWIPAARAWPIYLGYIFWVSSFDSAGSILSPKPALRKLPLGNQFQLRLLHRSLSRVLQIMTHVTSNFGCKHVIGLPRKCAVYKISQICVNKGPVFSGHTHKS